MARTPKALKKITVLIPCYNEAEGIASVITGIPRERLRTLGYRTHVIVIDNNSTDNTAAIAKHLGAEVITERKRGKGHAIRTGFRNVPEDTDFVVMLDGDDTYKSKEIPRLIEPLDAGFCHIVIGSRLAGNIQEGSMSFISRVGNWFFTFLVREFVHSNVTDVLTGMVAWQKDATDKLARRVHSAGFSIEMEMVMRAAKLGYHFTSVPITYEERAGESKLNPITDGWLIFRTFLVNLKKQP